MKPNSGSLFNCPKMCGRKNKSRCSISTHLKYECGIEPKFQCSIFSKKLKQSVYHRSHMFAIHKLILH